MKKNPFILEENDMYDYLPGFATEEDQKKLLQEYDELDKFDQIQKLKNKKNEVL